MEIFDPSAANNAEEEKAEASAHEAADAVKEEEEEAAELEEEIEEDQERMNEEIYADEDDNLGEADFMPDEENDLSKYSLALRSKTGRGANLLVSFQSTRVLAMQAEMQKCEKLTKCRKHRHGHILRPIDSWSNTSQARLAISSIIPSHGQSAAYPAATPCPSSDVT